MKALKSAIRMAINSFVKVPVKAHVYRMEPVLRFYALVILVCACHPRVDILSFNGMRKVLRECSTRMEYLSYKERNRGPMDAVPSSTETSGVAATT